MSKRITLSVDVIEEDYLLIKSILDVTTNVSVEHYLSSLLSAKCMEIFSMAQTDNDYIL